MIFMGGRGSRVGRGRGSSFIYGFLAGAAAVWLLDPTQGRARQVRLRDRVLSLGRRTRREVVSRSRDLKHRAQGLAREAEARLKEGPIPDDILIERVRAQMGRPVSHASVIEVKAESGCVTLYGPILRSEVEDLVSRVQKVRGVREVHNQLEVHESSGEVPGLQGKGGAQAPEAPHRGPGPKETV